jgi:hypothetical protein
VVVIVTMFSQLICVPPLNTLLLILALTSPQHLHHHHHHHLTSPLPFLPTVLFSFLAHVRKACTTSCRSQGASFSPALPFSTSSPSSEWARTTTPCHGAALSLESPAVHRRGHAPTPPRSSRALLPLRQRYVRTHRIASFFPSGAAPLTRSGSRTCESSKMDSLRSNRVAVSQPNAVRLTLRT